MSLIIFMNLQLEYILHYILIPGLQGRKKIMVDNQDKFVNELLEMSSNNISSNNTLFTRNKYTKLLEDGKTGQGKHKND